MSENGLDAGQEGGLDWEAVRRRVSQVAVAMEQSIDVSPEELRRVWAQRAADLAQLPVEEDEGEQIRLVLVRLGREIYGMDARYVYNVKPADLITHVPRVPEWVAGVVNLRGRILSVVNLRRFFDLPAAEGVENEGPESGGESYLVVVETPDMEIGLLADDVLAVESVPMSQIQDTAGVVRGLRPEYVQGVVMFRGDDAGGQDDGSMVVVLDLIALLADDQLVVREEVI
jgi:purine-binding chemotaxis protein CheW